MSVDIEAIKKRAQWCDGNGDEAYRFLMREDETPKGTRTNIAAVSDALLDRKDLLAEVERLTKDLDHALEAGHEAASNLDAATNNCRRFREESERLTELGKLQAKRIEKLEESAHNWEQAYYRAQRDANLARNALDESRKAQLAAVEDAFNIRPPDPSLVRKLMDRAPRAK